MADSRLDILIKFGLTGDGAKDALSQIDQLKTGTEEATKATEKQTSAVKESTEKFSENHREVRRVAGELGNMAGIGGLGGLALGGGAAAAVGLMKSLEFLEGSWESLRETIRGPIEVGLPEDAAVHISAAAEAWNTYAKARAAVTDAAGSSESTATAEEKRLANELKLVKEVLAAEKEKAQAELELRKNDLSPEAYAAAQANINNIFGQAGTAAEQSNRRQLITNKYTEAANLETDAQAKTRAALAIKSAHPADVEANQKALDENAAKATAAIPVLQKNIEMINRVASATKGDDVPEYQGSFGKFQKFSENISAYRSYGGMSLDDARAIETSRLDQARNAIRTADTYRDRESKAAEEKSRLMGEAGTESGKAEGLRKDAAADSEAEGRQTRVDAYVTQLHADTARKVSTNSAATADAVGKVLETTVGGFASIHAIVQRQAAELQHQASRLRILENQSAHQASRTFSQ